MLVDAVGVVGARLTYADGSFQHSAFKFPDLGQIWTEFFPTPGRFIEGGFNGRYEKDSYAGDKAFPVDFTLGATMMLRRDVLLETGLFDEDFFMYCEEVDWAWRIRNAGWEILCVPQAHVTHLGGQSTSQVRPRSLVNLWTSRLHLYEKHYPKWKLWLAKRLVMLGMRRKMAHLDKQADHYDEIQGLDAEVYGISTDSHFCHKAWWDSSETIGKVSYALMSDNLFTLSKSFGVLRPEEGRANRATFIIDPDGVIQAYELTAEGIGRDADDLIRKLKAARYVRAHPDEVCPAKWKEGDETLAPSLDLVGKI